jgi:hypothetical protein
MKIFVSKQEKMLNLSFYRFFSFFNFIIIFLKILVFLFFNFQIKITRVYLKRERNQDRLLERPSSEDITQN